MQAKLFELRDKATFVPVLAVLLRSDHSQEQYLLGRCGYARESDLVLLTGLEGADQCTFDPHDWGGNRTRLVAHTYIAANWNELKSGDVIDVEFVLGETSTPKLSESIQIQ